MLSVLPAQFCLGQLLDIATTRRDHRVCAGQDDSSTNGALHYGG
jgi:hypothetical protein